MRSLSQFAHLCILFSALVFLGCATSPGTEVLEGQDRGLSELTSIVTSALPGGKESVSQNGRTFTSKYFVTKDGEFDVAPAAPVRSKAIIQILGDRRPYSIEVTVIQERRTKSSEYVRIPNSEGLARVVIRRIQKALHERREDRNIIDDFRVF
jgi:hypothetical protein